MDCPLLPDIPDRSFFKIGEVAQLLGVPTSTIRYWQQEFWPHVRPVVTKSKHRIFSRKDVMALSYIYFLLRTQGYTIRGAKELLPNLLRKQREKQPAKPSELAESPLIPHIPKSTHKQQETPTPPKESQERIFARIQEAKKLLQELINDVLGEKF